MSGGVSNFLLTVGVAIAVFAVMMAAMAIGLIVRGKVLRGGCRGEIGPDGQRSCSACGGRGTGECRKSRFFQFFQRGNPEDSRVS